MSIASSVYGFTQEHPLPALLLFYLLIRYIVEGIEWFLRDRKKGPLNFGKAYTTVTLNTPDGNVFPYIRVIELVSMTIRGDFQVRIGNTVMRRIQLGGDGFLVARSEALTNHNKTAPNVPVRVTLWRGGRQVFTEELIDIAYDPERGIITGLSTSQVTRTLIGCGSHVTILMKDTR